MTKILLLIVTSVLSATGIAFLRKVSLPQLTHLSVSAIGDLLIQPNFWYGVFFSAITFLLYLWAITKYDASFVVPALLGINLATISIYSVLFFGETITLAKISAYALIFCGMWLLV
jgi:drug/metabolite transporter (DMT)-like permease